MARTGKPRGRPSTFTQDMAVGICARIANGETLKAICADPKTGVNRKTFSEWVLTKPDLKEMYEAARLMQFQIWADEIVELADAPLIGTVTTVKPAGTETKTYDNVARSGLQIESRKWLLARLNAVIFGDRVKNEHSGPNGAPMQFEKIERVIIDPKPQPGK